ncbi:hypothetical protein CSW27_08040 [Thermus scotoductus]|uniref:Uncharacterized protein n=1 Tax=Thermus scotoductus TaxID=37636 RepID=A0A430UWY7_THESC|nr:hypothetical protein CSW27_08040 [Thermus scotoductus]
MDKGEAVSLAGKVLLNRYRVVRPLGQGALAQGAHHPVSVQEDFPRQAHRLPFIQDFPSFTKKAVWPSLIQI